MKLSFNTILFTFLATILISCGSDDDAQDTTPITQRQIGTLDLNGLLASGGTDATAFVNYGQPAGIPNSEVTTTLIPGDNFLINFESGDPDVRLLLQGIFETEAAPLSLEAFDYYADILTLSGFGTETLTIEFTGPIGDGPPNNEEFRHEIRFTIETNGVEDPTVYRADPKLRVRSFR